MERIDFDENRKIDWQFFSSKLLNKYCPKDILVKKKKVISPARIKRFHENNK